jgi:hypothetical protein
MRQLGKLLVADRSGATCPGDGVLRERLGTKYRNRGSQLRLRLESHHV